MLGQALPDLAEDLEIVVHRPTVAGRTRSRHRPDG
jgi:hypothetical protein